MAHKLWVAGDYDDQSSRWSSISFKITSIASLPKSQPWSWGASAYASSMKRTPPIASSTTFFALRAV